MIRSLPFLLGLVTVVCSCGTLGLGGKKANKLAPSPFGATGIPPQLRPKSSDPVGPGVPVVATAPGQSGKPVLNLTPQEDIVYTDPDNPEAGIPELGDLLAQTKRGPWEQSETIAKRRSVREGKPLLIWFSDTRTSPMCKAISQELFATNDFGNWATEKLVRLKVDAVINVDDVEGDTETRRIQILNFNAAIKKRYKVSGYPALVMLSPSGEVVGHYRGYKRGEGLLLWGKLKHAEAVAAESHKGWRGGLEKKGYREWQDRKERKVFARLTSYSDGKLALLEPDGTRSQTSEAKLSDADQQWIAEQKKLRQLQ